MCTVCALTLVARWLTAFEANLDDCHQHRWSAHPGSALAYLDRLIGAEYVLSEAEQAVYEDVAAEVTADEAGNSWL